MSVFRVVWKGAGESLLQDSASLPKILSSFLMAAIVPSALPPLPRLLQCQGFHYFLLIDLHYLTACPDEVFIGQGIFFFVQCIVHSCKLTPLHFLTRGTPPLFAMGGPLSTDQLVAEGGGGTEASSPFWPGRFPPSLPKFGLTFTRCQMSRLSSMFLPLATKSIIACVLGW